MHKRWSDDECFLYLLLHGWSFVVMVSFIYSFYSYFMFCLRRNWIEGSMFVLCPGHFVFMMGLKGYNFVRCLVIIIWAGFSSKMKFEPLNSPQPLTKSLWWVNFHNYVQYFVWKSKLGDTPCQFWSDLDEFGEVCQRGLCLAFPTQLANLTQTTQFCHRKRLTVLTVRPIITIYYTNGLCF